MQIDTHSSKGLLATTSSQAAVVPSEIEEKIVYENQKYWQNRFLFGNEYMDFVYDLSLYWNTTTVIPRTYLTKNDDFDLMRTECPPEYKSNPNIPEAGDVSLPLKPEEIEEFELRIFKFAAQFYLTILGRS